MAPTNRPPRRRSSTLRESPGTPPALQVGALCWRRNGEGELRVLLITSRDTGRWVIPKGWPMRNRTDAEAAAREAFEEAGVTGVAATRSLGLYPYDKVLGKGRFVPCVVRVFALAVAGLAEDFPERGQRRIKWFPPDKAAKKVLEPELALLIRDFAPEAEAEAEAEDERS
jgi:8-oxo-dGTP pyrophosphatase MutT (NUDIX family)